MSRGLFTAVCFMLAACGGTTIKVQSHATLRFTVGGHADGVHGTLVLQNNHAENVIIVEDADFVFQKPLDRGGVYEVTVASAPPGYTCLVRGGVGQVGLTNVSEVLVSCYAGSPNDIAIYQVSGALQGSRGVVSLSLGPQSLSLTEDGAYSFSTPFSAGTYPLAVTQSPTGQRCSTSAASVTVTDSNVTDVAVMCKDLRQVGGVVTGLIAQTQLTLTNGTDRVSVSANGPFFFPTTVVPGSAYDVAVGQQPEGTQCQVFGGSGLTLNQDVDTVAVVCSPRAYPVDVWVGGLAPGTTVTLTLDGNTLAPTGNGHQTVAYIMAGTPYSIGLQSQPPHQVCTLSQNQGTSTFATTQVMVACHLVVAFNNAQTAALAVGQASLTTNLAPNPPNARSLNVPYGKAYASQSNWFYVADLQNNRVLGYSPIPTDSNAQASLVLGQNGDFTIRNAAAGASGLNAPCNVASDENVLLITDYGNSRVLLYRALPVTNRPADLAIGQPSLDAHLGSCSATGLNVPTSAQVVNNRVIVADAGNSRVLIYNKIPTASAPQADLVLGQGDFTHCTQNRGSSANANTLRSPQDAWSDGVHLAVADLGNNRVLWWNAFPTYSGQPADLVLGQPDFTTTTAGSGAKFNVPEYVASDGTSFFVGDQQNSRVVAFAALPTSNMPTPSYVLGQVTAANSACNAAGVNGASLCGATGVSFAGTSLVVTDSYNSRILFYQSN